MEVLTTSQGQNGLPCYFASVFEVSRSLKQGRLDFVMTGGRRFRAEGANPGPACEILLHDPDVFARLTPRAIWGSDGLFLGTFLQK